MNPSEFRRHLRAPGDPRIAGIERCDAYSWAERALASPRGGALFAEWLARYRNEDFRGITTDGERVPGLFRRGNEEAPVGRAAAAVERLLAGLDAAQRTRLCYPLNARERRAWMNPEVYLNRFGLRLDEIGPSVREGILAVLQASMSERGFARARDLMRINHFLGELVNGARVLNEWSYNFNLFGAPSATEPWGWSLYGHHLCLNALFVGEQMVFTPVFMGAEPSGIDAGPYAGLTVFTDEERLALDLMRALPQPERRAAQLYLSQRDPNMPPGRVAIADELMLAGAFRDNRVIPYEGARAGAFAAPARKKLLDLIAVYLAYLPAGPLAVRMAAVERHLVDTYFCWIGPIDDSNPFYYRIQSPVIVIELDHHCGVFLGNTQPAKFHIHTIVRTPNGNDYGMAIL